MFQCKPETKEEINQEIVELNARRHELRNEVSKLYSEVDEKTERLNTLNQTIKLQTAVAQGKKISYILTLELSQSHFTLDLEEHMKDALNAIEFELPVDKELFDNVKVGTRIVDDFRVGSLLLRGSLGSWDMKVTDKEIRY